MWDEENDEHRRPRTRERERDDDGWQPFQPPAPARTGGAVASGGVDIGLILEMAARQGPRDHRTLLERAEVIGTMMGRETKAKGESVAFYRWEVSGKRGKSIVEGPTIDLMDALAGEWGRLVYEVQLIELVGQQAKLRGRVIDLVTLNIHQRDYLAHISPAPGRMANDPDQVQRWLTMQMQAAESKAIRGVLEHALPAWFTGVAVKCAMAAHAKLTLGDKSLPEATQAVLASFVDGPKMKDGSHPGWAILPHELEGWVGASIASWTVHELAALRVLYRELKGGQMSVGSFRTECAARMAMFQAEQATAAPDSGDDDLGLGDSPAPVATSVGVSTERGPGPAAGPLAPPPTGAGQPPSMRELVLKQIGDIEEVLKGRGVNVKAVREEVGVQRILSTTSMERVVLLRDALKRAVETSEPLPPPEVPGGERNAKAELLAELKAQRLVVGEKAWAAALVAVGMTSLDSATEGELGTLLDTLTGGGYP